MRLTAFFLLGLLLVPLAAARSFTVVVYNVENLFDADGVAVYEDYRGEKYPPAHLSTKLANIARVLAKVNDGAGPDIVLFNEIEADQTPGTTVAGAAGWIGELGERRYDALLGQSPLPPELAGVPAEVWLLKALHDEGLRGYTIIDGEDRPGALAVKCVTFSRFPVKRTRLHPLQNARPIIEAELDVDGQPLIVFNNHWKSGAGDPATEADRRANARTLRDRLDALLADDPNADILVGGDLNSHYNQKVRYREMRETGINDILGSQGNQLAIRGKDRDLYNLWFELPSTARGSDVFRGEWGTLMHIILSRGLFDLRGVQYEPGSFTVMKIPGTNADARGLPQRWRPYSATGSGFSDHFPLLARFRTVDDDRADRWLPATRPEADEDDEVIKVDYARVDLLAGAPRPEDLPADADLRDGTHNGKIFAVAAAAHVTERGHVKVTVGGLDYDVYSHKKTVRDVLRARAREHGRLEFHGELGVYKGNWQFLVHDKEWIR